MDAGSGRSPPLQVLFPPSSLFSGLLPLLSFPTLLFIDMIIDIQPDAPLRRGRGATVQTTRQCLHHLRRFLCSQAPTSPPAPGKHGTVTVGEFAWFGISDRDAQCVLFVTIMFLWSTQGHLLGGSFLLSAEHFPLCVSDVLCGELTGTGALQENMLGLFVVPLSPALEEGWENK